MIASTTLPAGAGWRTHNDADASEFIPPYGASEEQACKDQLLGRAGIAEFVDIADGQEPGDIDVPATSPPIPYGVYKAPAGVILTVEFDDQGEPVLGYNEGGVFVPATRVKSFQSAQRKRIATPFPANGNPNVSSNWVFSTSALFSESLTSVQAGQTLAVWPFEIESAPVVRFTAIDCGDRGFFKRWEGTKQFCPSTAGKASLADVTGDRRSDLVCHSRKSGRVAVARATAAGQFNGATWSKNLGYCRKPGKKLLLADVDRDRRSDLVCHTKRTGRVAVAYATKLGKFPKVNWSDKVGFCRGPGKRVAAADVNGDRRADLVCHSKRRGALAVTYATAKGRFTGTDWSSDVNFCRGPGRQVLTGRIDKGRRNDLLCHRPKTGGVTVAYAKPKGRFTGVDWKAKQAYCKAPGKKLYLADVSGEGRSDLACQQRGTGRVTITYAGKQGRFKGFDWTRNLGFCRSPAQLLVGDVSADRRADLVCHRPGLAVQEIAYSDL